MITEKRASVKDIAERLHVSLSTVHKALTGKPGVGEKRRAQVISVAEELGYVVNTAAQALARNDMKFGIIMPSQWEEYFGELKLGIDAEIENLAEYRLKGSYFFISDSSLSDEIIEWLRDVSADAILICSSNRSFRTVITHAVEKSRLPSFWIGGGVNNPNAVSSITIDAETSGKIAADFFAATLFDKVQAAVFTGSMHVEVHKEKVDAFSERVADLGGTVYEIYETEDNEDLAYHSVCELFRKHPYINSIYISTSTSSAVCKYIEENNLKNRVSVIGTDVFEVLYDYIKRGVMRATIYQNQQEVGKTAVRYAYEYLSNKNSYSNCGWEERKEILVPPALFMKANLEQTHMAFSFDF